MTLIVKFRSRSGNLLVAGVMSVIVNLSNYIKCYLRRYVDRNGRYPFKSRSDNKSGWVLELGAREKHRLVSGYKGEEQSHFTAPFWQELIWLFILISDATNAWYKYGKQNHREYINFVPDIIKIISLGRRYNFAPYHYFDYRLFRENGEKIASRLIPNWTFGMLCRRLSRLRKLPVASLDNKFQFFDFCHKHGLSTIPIIRVEDIVSLEIAGQFDLFVKPPDNFGGKGCLALKYNSVKNKWIVDGNTVSRATLKAYLDSRFGGKAYLIPHSPDEPLSCCRLLPIQI